jgi:hypothetical protein
VNPRLLHNQSGLSFIEEKNKEKNWKGEAMRHIPFLFFGRNSSRKFAHLSTILIVGNYI